MRRFPALLLVLAGFLAGCSIDGGRSAAPVPGVQASKLRVLHESFANPQVFHRAASIDSVARLTPIVDVRPDAALASDHSIDSVWVGTPTARPQRDITLVWKSGVVETIERWTCNCVAASGLGLMGHQKPFRFLMLRGAPAVTAPSDPGANAASMTGLVAPAELKYGTPASVETIRDGYNITLWEYGPHVQAGLLAVARTLPVDHPAFQVSGYEAGGAALGDWHGPQGIVVAPQGGARFGLGVALKNISGKPLTITNVHTIDGFIRLAGIHFRPYAPPTGSAIGPPITGPPYDSTALQVAHQLKPNGWVGIQLDYQVMSPCVPWSSTIYDRSVEVTYTQAGVGHIQAIPMVQLNITRHHHC